MEIDKSFSRDLLLWDKEDALKRVMDKQEILEILVTVFLSDMPEYAKTLADDLARKDTVSAAKSAHALKGVAGNLSTLALAEILRKIESACLGNVAIEEILQLHAAFEEIFPKTCAVLAEWKNSH